MRSAPVTREDQARLDLADEANALAFPPAPEGYELRWIRLYLRNELDYKNVNQMFDREGYEPVMPEEVPQAFRFSTVSGTRFDGAILNGDLILGKIPVEKAEAHRQRIRARTAMQTEGIRNQLMRVSDSRMPITDDSRQSVSYGTKRPAIDD